MSPQKEKRRNSFPWQVYEQDLYKLFKKVLRNKPSFKHTKGSPSSTPGPLTLEQREKRKFFLWKGKFHNSLYVHVLSKPILSEQLFPFPHKLMMPWKITVGITEYLGLVTGYFPSKAVIFINRTTGMVKWIWTHIWALLLIWNLRKAGKNMAALCIKTWELVQSKIQCLRELLHTFRCLHHDFLPH